MRSVIRVQLDDEAIALLNTRLTYHRGSRSALARELGISRSGLSMAMDGKYPGSTGKLRSLIFETLADRLVCPHLEAELSPHACKALRERPLSAASGSRSDAKHWQACQACRYNPAANKASGGDHEL